MQITTWAGAYSRREWSGMIKGYYQAKTRIWLNATLQQAAAAATVARLDTKVLDGAARYSAYGGFDCNFADIGDRKELCTGKSKADCIAALEAACDANSKCVGFNYPGDILKSACPACTKPPPRCSGWEPARGSTFYFKPGHGPPAPLTSSCEGKFCYVQSHGNGTFNGTDCGQQCPPKPAPPNVKALLTQFETEWALERWVTPKQFAAYPAAPVGDPVSTAAAMLKKYGK